MRWEKGKDYVEIASGNSVDGKGAVWHVETSVGLNNLPIELHNQISKTDEEGYEKLKQNASNWAERNEYQLVSSDAA